MQTQETWADALCMDERSGANHLVKARVGEVEALAEVWTVHGLWPAQEAVSGLSLNEFVAACVTPSQIRRSWWNILRHCRMFFFVHMLGHNETEGCRLLSFPVSILE